MVCSGLLMGCVRRGCTEIVELVSSGLNVDCIRTNMK